MPTKLESIHFTVLIIQKIIDYHLAIKNENLTNGGI